MKKGVVAVVVLLAAVVAAVWFVRRDSRAVYYTGFVEGEERVIRSEVVGRVLEVAFAEGAAVPPNSVVGAAGAGLVLPAGDSAGTHWRRQKRQNGPRQ